MARKHLDRSETGGLAQTREIKALRRDLENLPPAPVTSVNTQTGDVVLDADDIDDAGTTHQFATSAQLAKVDHLTVTQAVDLDAMETKLAGIASGAEVNENADWTSGSGDSQILNKPPLLLAVEALAANGLVARTSASTAAARTITAGANISVSNGDGVLGNPTIAVSGSLGQPIPTSSTFAVGSLAFGIYLSATGVADGATFAGSNFRLPISGPNVDTLADDGAIQTGTWRNVSGITLDNNGGAGTARWGCAVRTA